MTPISPQALQLVHNNVPHLPEAVRNARERAEGTLRRARLSLYLEDFEDDAFTFYAAVWYVLSEEVDVLVQRLRPRSARQQG